VLAGLLQFLDLICQPLLCPAVGFTLGFHGPGKGTEACWPQPACCSCADVSKDGKHLLSLCSFLLLTTT
jgi:hypothetical protein